VYIGQALVPEDRWRAHARNPPRRMKADALQYQPFAEHFHCQRLGYRTSSHAADRAERALIRLYDATGPKGYNTLESAPKPSKRYHAIRRTLAKKRTAPSPTS
jgi:hypothetical protein